ncbi:uncharacterized protein LOC144616628 [Panthera onca]
MPHMSGEARRGFLLISRRLNCTLQEATQRKGGNEARKGGSKRPKKVQVSLSQHPGSLNIFFSFSTSMRCNAELPGKRRLQVGEFFACSRSLDGRARRLLTLRVLEERHGATACVLGFPTGCKAVAAEAAAAGGRELEGPEGKRQGGGSQRGEATQTNVALGGERRIKPNSDD